MRDIPAGNGRWGEQDRSRAWVEPFSATLARHGLELTRLETQTLQVNVGLKCNQLCRHCHLDAGPHRTEMMDRDVAEAVVSFARRNAFQAIDITGGAPELNPNLPFLIEELAPLAPRLMLRSNLTALADVARERLLELCRERQVVLMASLPSSHPSQVDAQRGDGVMEKSLSVLHRLNALGYGLPHTGLELDLVSNPTGAFLPPAQSQAEVRFKRDLERKWGLRFNALFTFANVPLGRFGKWLADSGNYDAYMQRLVSGFNPCTLGGVMCRTLLSVSWDGHLFDCDFNLARGLPAGGRAIHVSKAKAPPPPGTPVAVSNHCYACAAGSGFT